jgi:hypothetical protein
MNSPPKEEKMGMDRQPVIYIANATLSSQLQVANLRPSFPGSTDSRTLGESHKLKVLINVLKTLLKRWKALKTHTYKNTAAKNISASSATLKFKFATRPQSD